MTVAIVILIFDKGGSSNFSEKRSIELISYGYPDLISRTYQFGKGYMHLEVSEECLDELP